METRKGGEEGEGEGKTSRQDGFACL